MIEPNLELIESFPMEVRGELWLRLSRTSSTYDPEKATEAHLYSVIVANMHKDEVRKTQSNLRRVGGYADYVQILNRERAQSAQSTDDLVDFVVRTLNERELDLVKCKAIGMSESALAAHFEVPPGTIKSRLRRIRDKVEKAMGVSIALRPRRTRDETLDIGGCCDDRIVA